MNKQTRLEHYKILLDAYERKHEDTFDNGFCWAFKKIIGTDAYYGQFEILYPELYSQKPQDEKHGFYWWSTRNRKSRINALKKAIELCQ